MGMLQRRKAKKLIQAYLEKIETLQHRVWPPPANIAEARQVILDASPEIQIEVILVSFTMRFKQSGPESNKSAALESVRHELLKCHLPFSDSQIIVLMEYYEFNICSISLVYSVFINTVEEWARIHPLPKRVRNILARTADFYEGGSRDGHRMANRIRAILGNAPQLILKPLEVWSKQAIVELSQLDDEEWDQWMALLLHCQAVKGARPTIKWRRAASSLLEAMGNETFLEMVFQWFPLVDQPRMEPYSGNTGEEEFWRYQIVETHADILKGMVWCCAQFEGANIAHLVTNLAISAYRKVRYHGPRLIGLGNACVWSLGAMEGEDGLNGLARLKVKVKSATARNMIEKAYLATAERRGIPRDDLEEMSVSTCGLTGVGELDQQLGEYTARLRIKGTGTGQLTWEKENGKVVKAVPKAVREEFPEELKALRATMKEIRTMLPVQKERVDGLYLLEKTWPLKVWRELYLDHPLVGTLARRLIWEFKFSGGHPVSVMYDNGRFVSVNGEPVETTDASSEVTVSLWHPIDREVDEVVAWREFVEYRGITQPFKQAHREVYVITDAERATEVYSNRFAAHVLKQHQFNALCAARYWKNRLRLLFDSEFPPASRDLPYWGLRAEFWIDGIGEDYGVHTNDTGSFHFLATDQVRFYPIQARKVTAHAYGGGYRWTPWQEGDDLQPIPLAEIPALVFSEVMRDVDLFVGVSSVGNDPAWMDGGENEQHADYWRSYACGDLAETAKIRKSVLERLVPRLKIADRCSFQDRFLVVRGTKRTYKIHLGSGNILMEPNDRYLCIVGKSDDRWQDGVMLPFEGDRMLSIVLSKALLLATDAKIKDPVILAQIQ